ncbi:MAG TPA: tetratricopeptide repeat protein, partial [Nitrospiria bacterium]|nr:tetratricopeptide repeat protein [Nitrospiria bacterium]
MLGRAYYEKGELDNAADILKKAVSDTPESYLGQKFLGKVFLDKGEIPGALRAFEAANLLSPEDDEVSRLLEEVKSKATPPETIEYKENDAEPDLKDRIVTYEQKPTTIDGVELVPLPTRKPDEPFSFSDGDITDPADMTPAAGVEEIAPALNEISEMTAGEFAGEDMAATVIDEEEVEQALEVESLDDLGPEAAAFIQEGEELMEESVEGPPGEADFAVGDALEEVIIEPEEVMSPPAPSLEPVPASAPAPASSMDSTDAEASTDAQGAMVDKSENRPAPEPEFPSAASAPPEPPSLHGAREEKFSTETMADLYAQQGLIEKAMNIYQQILDQTPDNEMVRLKLEALKVQVPSDAGTAQAGPAPENA